MKQVPEPTTGFFFIVMTTVVALVIAAVVRGSQVHRPEDACGKVGLHPITIGGSIIIGCLGLERSSASTTTGDSTTTISPG
jgi:hypothetical protein